MNSSKIAVAKVADWDLWEHFVVPKHLRAPGVNFRVEDMAELLGEEAHNRQTENSFTRDSRSSRWTAEAHDRQQKLTLQTREAHNR